jgi:hypothetical protein
MAKNLSASFRRRRLKAYIDIHRMGADTRPRVLVEGPNLAPPGCQAQILISMPRLSSCSILYLSCRVHEQACSSAFLKLEVTVGVAGNADCGPFWFSMSQLATVSIADFIMGHYDDIFCLRGALLGSEHIEFPSQTEGFPIFTVLFVFSEIALD